MKSKQEIEAHLREVLDASPIGAGISNIENGTVKYVNSRNLEILGLTKDDFLGESAKNYWFDLADREEFQKKFRRDGRASEDVLMKRADGTPFWVHLTWERSPAFPGDVIFWAQDISKLKKAQKEQKRSEEKLIRHRDNLAELVAERSRDFQSILDNLQDIFYRTDLEGRIVMISPSVENIFGYTPDELIGRKMADFYIYPYERMKFLAELEQGGGSVFGFEGILGHKDGHEVVVSTSAHYYKNEDGQVMGLEGLTRDITERKQAENILHNLVEGTSADIGMDYFHHLLQHLADGLGVDYAFIGELPSGAPKRVRTTAVWAKGEIAENFEYNLAGTPCEKVVGKEICCYPDRVQQLFPTDHLLVEMGVRAYAGVPLFTRDGTALGVLVALDSKPMQSNQTVESMLTIFAARAGAELERERAAETTRKLSQAVEQGSATVVITDTDGTIEYVNRRFGETTGYSAEEAVGQNQRLLKSGLTSPEKYEELWQTITTGKEWRGEFHNKKKNGELFWESVSISPIKAKDGTITNFLAIKDDITDRRRLEEQLRRSQKMEAVGQLTGGIAHDFNNLLNIVMGKAELLGLKIEGNEKAQKDIEAIVGAVRRGASLTQRLLAFSRKQSLSPQPTAINGLVLGLADMLQRSLGETVELRTAFETGACEALIDQHQFENALINLAVNAKHAMPKGGALTIETATTALDATYAEQHEEVMPGDYVEVTVSDTGTGMSPEVLKKVFDPFFTTKDVGEGSGLGLSMVYGFAKQSNGHITIDSEEGHGTTVKLYLPRSHEAPAKENIKVETPEFALGSERILVVEDDDAVREVSTDILRNQGYEVFLAKDGEEAIARLKRGPSFDLLFTDIVLPGGMNGVEIAKQAKRIQPEIKVLYTTGYANDAFAHNDTQVRDMALINKPYRRAELLERVHEIIDRADN